MNVSIAKEKPYFVLTGIHKDFSSPEIILGDYERQALKDEKDCVSHEYHSMKITKLPNDKEAYVAFFKEFYNHD